MYPTYPRANENPEKTRAGGGGTYRDNVPPRGTSRQDVPPTKPPENKGETCPAGHMGHMGHMCRGRCEVTK